MNRSNPVEQPPHNSGFKTAIARLFTSNRLATKYLWLSLLVTLIPLLGFASLYDTYFSRMASQLTEEQLATRMAATQNEFRVFLRERKFELEALADQFDVPALFTPQGRQQLSTELEGLLRLQVDARHVYGVVFFDSKGKVSWSFPKQQKIHLDQLNHSIEFEGTELLGPTPYSLDQPAKMVLRTRNSSLPSSKNLGSMGLIIRFNSLAETLRRLDQGGTFQVLLRAPDGYSYDVVGQRQQDTVASQTLSLIPGWSIDVIQDHALVMSPLERMRYWLILLMGCTVAGLLWLYISISRRLNRQADSLITSVEKVAEGDLDSPVAPVSGREMQRLTHAIELMRKQLKSFISSRLEAERQVTLGQLAAGLAHDIRNPLTTIRTTVSALSKREEIAENREMMAMVEEEIERVNEVVEHLLNFARPREPHAESINTSTLLDSLLTLVAASARKQGVTIKVECCDNLVVWADEGHLRQVLMNVIFNALEAMSVKGDRINLKASPLGDEVVIVIADNGPGIPEETLRHIMEPFFTTKPAGTGLGLAICNSLVKSNAGTINVCSQVNQGTTIALTLPAIDSKSINQ